MVGVHSIHQFKGLRVYYFNFLFYKDIFHSHVEDSNSLLWKETENGTENGLEDKVAKSKEF